MPLKPFIRGGGYFASRKWTPLVRYNGLTTSGDDEEEPVDPSIIRTVTGFSPITLIKAIAHSILSLTQYGKCELRDPDVPEGWKRVEYLRSSGDAYIDLGYKGGPNTKVKVRYRYHTQTGATGSGRVFGSRITAASDAFAFGTSSGVVSNTGNKVFWCYDAQPFFVVDDPAFALDQWIEVVFSATEHTIDGVSYGEDYTPTAFETPSNLKLFGFDNNGTMGVGYVDIESCQLWDGSTLLRDLIPVYNGTEYAMRDKVSDTILHNAGTGAFTGGAATTQSPDRPMDIWCNNGVLRYSANMANVNADTALVGYYISTAGVVTADGNNWMYQDYIPVKPSTTYTLSMSQSVYFVSISEYSTAEDSGFIIRKAGSTGDNTSLTITTEANTNFIRFGTNLDRQPITLERVLAINWMLTQSATALPYAPYVAPNGGIYPSGTPETLTVSGKNLLDPSIVTSGTSSGITISEAQDGTITASGSLESGTYAQFTYTMEKALPAGTYTISLNNPTALATGSLVGFGINGNVSVGSRACGLNATNATKTFTIGEGDVANRLVIRLNGDLTGFSMRIQVESGTADTDYQPYVVPQTVNDIPTLLSVGDYKDTKELIGGLLTHKVGVKLLTGDENWLLATSTNLVQFYTSDFSREIMGNASIVSTVAPYGCTVSNRTQYDFGCYSGSTGNLCFQMQGDETLTTTTIFKNRLRSDLEAGRPWIAIYPLATETTEQTTPHALNSYAGTTVVEAATNVDPVTLTCEYKGVADE